MELGVLTTLFSEKSLDETLDFVEYQGLKSIELGTGNYLADTHCNLDELLEDDGKLENFKRKIAHKDLMISALSCHGNPLHPQKRIAESAHRVFIKSVDLANKLGVTVVNTLSGCPGDHAKAKYPHWPVTPWPPEYQEILGWQWEQKIVPYWKECASYARERSVRIALEPAGGFSVHSPQTLLRLREAVGETIGVNFDPSHLWWQGIDPVQAILILGEAGAIYHVHAKDTATDVNNMNRHGVLDMNSWSSPRNRAWQFRTVGFGHDLKTWADIISALRIVNYDFVVSIEHEDALMSVQEGFAKAVANLKQVIIKEPMGEAWWA